MSVWYGGSFDLANDLLSWGCVVYLLAEFLVCGLVVGLVVLGCLCLVFWFLLWVCGLFLVWVFWDLDSAVWFPGLVFWRFVCVFYGGFLRLGFVV